MPSIRLGSFEPLISSSVKCLAYLPFNSTNIYVYVHIPGVKKLCDNVVISICTKQCQTCKEDYKNGTLVSLYACVYRLSSSTTPAEQAAGTIRQVGLLSRASPAQNKGRLTDCTLYMRLRRDPTGGFPAKKSSCSYHTNTAYRIRTYLITVRGHLI